jgi:hypothetical protein
MLYLQKSRDILCIELAIEPIHEELTVICGSRTDFPSKHAHAADPVVWSHPVPERESRRKVVRNCEGEKQNTTPGITNTITHPNVRLQRHFLIGLPTKKCPSLSTNDPIL